MVIKSKNKDVIHLEDSLTGELLTYKRVVNKPNGVALTPDDVDNYVYRLKGSEYYQLTVPHFSDKFLVKNSMLDFRNLSKSEINLLKLGEYEGVELTGYYTKGDLGNNVIYKISNKTELPDSGGFVSVGGLLFERGFIGRVDVKSFGAKGDGVTDDIVSIEKCILYAANRGLSVFFPSGVYYISRTLNIKYNINISGVSNTSGGSFIKYTGSNVAVIFKKDNFVSGSVNSWIYASYFNDIGIIGENRKAVGLELWGVSESYFDKISVTGFKTGVKLVDCSILRFDFLVASNCDIVQDYSSYDKINRYVVNANIVVNHPDFYGNNLVFKLNAVDGLLVDNFGWIESNNKFVLCDNSEDFVEVRGVEFNNLQCLFNTPNFDSLLDIKDLGATRMFCSISLFAGLYNFVSTIVNNSAYPVKVVDNGSNDSFIRLYFDNVKTYSDYSSFSFNDSWKSYLRFNNCRFFKSSDQRLFVPEISPDSKGLNSVVSVKGQVYNIGVGCDLSPESTLNVHKKYGSTNVRIKAGDFQSVEVFEILSKDGSSIFSVRPNNALNLSVNSYNDNSSAVSAGLKKGDLYSSNGVLMVVV